MRVGESFHLYGTSRTNEPSFVLEFVNNADKHFNYERREYYETPLHIHSWFVHPVIPAWTHHYEIVAGPGLKHADWTNHQVVPMNFARNQPYHFLITKGHGGFVVRINGAVIIYWVAERASRCTNLAYVTFTHVHKAWKDNDYGCTMEKKKPKKKTTKKRKTTKATTAKTATTSATIGPPTLVTSTVATTTTIPTTTNSVTLNPPVLVTSTGALPT
ncbi:unnamed protein product [Bursaphelenchus okinawaensis]|uniref:Galectin domain-containing protein n=1 Tax=Bursaphelenchus okinawaensis TaxID=465554 RepID=A0A811LDS0_9BILA|nr:unnamed protein product [Bursaphelenchus okinawaensis]CAG9122018.1 unnamed protein product [Bursaphelenchus okinawaensis]